VVARVIKFAYRDGWQPAPQVITRKSTGERSESGGNAQAKARYGNNQRGKNENSERVKLGNGAKKDKRLPLKHQRKPPTNATESMAGRRLKPAGCGRGPPKGDRGGGRDVRGSVEKTKTKKRRLIARRNKKGGRFWRTEFRSGPTR